MNLAAKIRYCQTCPKDSPTILNFDTIKKGLKQCNSCREKAFKNELFPTPPAPKIAPRPKVEKPRKERVYLSDRGSLKGTCDNCKREDMALRPRSLGHLCTYCRNAYKGLTGKEAKAALLKARKDMKGRGKMAGRGYLLRRKNDRRS